MKECNPSDDLDRLNETYRLRAVAMGLIREDAKRRADGVTLRHMERRATCARVIVWVLIALAWSALAITVALLTIRSMLLLQSCERSWTRACNAYIQAGRTEEDMPF